MAKIQTIKNKDSITVYPQTHTQAVYDANGKKLQDWMNEYFTAEDPSAIEDVNTQFEIQGNKTNILNSDSTDIQYPTARATYKLIMDSLASMAGQLKLEVIDHLPETGDTSTIYLLSNENTEGTNIYEEYLYVNSTWELIGTTKVDLSGYLQKAGDTVSGDITMTAGTNFINSVSNAQIKFLENGNIRIDAPLASGGSAAITIGTAGINLINGTTAVIQTNETGVNLKANTSMTSHSLTDLIDPVNAQDAATKSYVDNAIPDISGLALKTEVPTKTSELNNDSGFITNIELNNKITYGTTTLEDGISELATGTLYVVYEE